ncbi:MAG: hypothetical protein U9N32_01490, partial [Spirochaetota bacterium]|nr:hypothetical protein [Spirochaetota bacterium]
TVITYFIWIENLPLGFVVISIIGRFSIFLIILLIGYHNVLILSFRNFGQFLQLFKFFSNFRDIIV